MKRLRALTVRPRVGGGTRDRGRSGIWLTAFLVAILSVVALPARAQPGFDSIVAQFEEVAFGSEHGNRTSVVRKWTENPGLALFKLPDYDITPYVESIGRHLQVLSDLTGISVSLADAPSEATLRLGFYPRAEFVNMPGSSDDPEFVRWVSTSACIALAVSDRDNRGSIAAGAIAIGTDIPESQREHCILEELIQVMGLPNDACHYRPSLFCEDDRVFELTAADEILLRTLYDARLVAGTPKEAAMPVVRRIVAELMEEQIAQAH